MISNKGCTINGHFFLHDKQSSISFRDRQLGCTRLEACCRYSHLLQELEFLVSWKMLLPFQMILAVEGMTSPNLQQGAVVTSRLECVSRCYHKKTCSSLFYNSLTGMCHLLDTVYQINELVRSAAEQEYFVWETGKFQIEYQIELVACTTHLDKIICS